MQPQAGSTLDVIYENWRSHQEKLRDCVVPLTNKQLLLQPVGCLTAYRFNQIEGDSHEPK